MDIINSKRDVQERCAFKIIRLTDKSADPQSITFYFEINKKIIFYLCEARLRRRTIRYKIRDRNLHIHIKHSIVNIVRTRVSWFLKRFLYYTAYKIRNRIPSRVLSRIIDRLKRTLY